MNSYLKQRTLEALGSAPDNDLSDAAVLLAEWALQDSRLLQSLTAPWLKTAAAKAVEHVAIETTQRTYTGVESDKAIKRIKNSLRKGIKTTTYRHNRGSATPAPLIGGNDPIIQTIIGNIQFADPNPDGHKTVLHSIAKAHAEQRLMKAKNSF